MTSADFFEFLPDFYRNIREYDCIFTAIANKINRIEEKRKQEKLAKESVPAEVENENTEA